MRVLIVDDNAGFRATARLVLESDGLEVVGLAADTVQARMEAGRLRPDVVIIDVELADEDGFAVAEALAGDLAGSAALVMVSARNADDFTERLAAAPVIGFIAKERISSATLTELISGR